MIFNPFFIKCSLSEPNDAFRRQLKNLAFGKGGLVFTRGDAQFLSAGDGEFRVPDECSEKVRRELIGLFRDAEYDELATKIFQQRTGMRKADRLRTATDAVLRTDSLPMGRAKEIHVYILLAILLELVDSINEAKLHQYTLNFIIEKTRTKSYY